jgi:hypothetical protein
LPNPRCKKVERVTSRRVRPVRLATLERDSYAASQLMNTSGVMGTQEFGAHQAGRAMEWNVQVRLRQRVVETRWTPQHPKFE